MTDLTLRFANPADAGEITQVLRDSIAQLCVADHGNRAEPLAAWLDNKTPANIESWVCADDNVMLVAVAEGAIAGVGGLRKDGHIVLNYVAPAHRFRGVSKAMLRALEHEASALGLSRLTLESTTTAHDMYRAAGYADAGAPDTKHGLTVFPMRKELA